MASKNVVAIALKMVGGRQIAREATEAGDAIHTMGQKARKAGDEAGKTHGWEVFQKKTHETRKATEKHSHAIRHALSTGAAYATGAVGAYGLLSIAQSGVSDVGAKLHELNKLESVGLTGNRQQTLITAAALKARGLSTQNLITASKTLAKSQQIAAQQEEKYGQSIEKTRWALQKNLIAQEKAKANGKTEQLQMLQLEAGHIRQTAHLGRQALAYKELGINAAKFGKMSGTAQLKLIEGRLSNLPPGLDKVRIATVLLGRGGTSLLPVLNKGALGLGAMEKAAKEFLPTFGKGKKGMENMEVAQARLSLATEGLKLRIGLALMPVLITVIKWFTKLYSNITHGRGAWKGIEKAIGAVATVAKEFIGTFIEVIKWIGKSEAGAILLGSALAGLAAVWGVEKILGFIKAIRSSTLFLALFGTGEEAVTAQSTLMWAAITGGVILAIAGIVILIKHWSTVKKFFTGVWHAIESGAVWAWKNVISKFTAVGLIISHWKGIVKFFEGLPAVFAKVGEAIWKALLGSFKWMINTFVLGPLNFVIGAINKLATVYNDIPIHIGTAPHIKPIPALAHGGVVRQAGQVLVGERGPEVLSLPPWARVDPLPAQSRGPLSWNGAYEGQNGDLHVHVEVEGKEIAQAVLRQFRKMEARS